MVVVLSLCKVHGQIDATNALLKLQKLMKLMLLPAEFCSSAGFNERCIADIELQKGNFSRIRTAKTKLDEVLALAIDCRWCCC